MDCNRENPILLRFANHEFNISLETGLTHLSKEIVHLSFNLHSSDKLQSLDVAVFGPFKTKLKVPFN